MAKNSRNKVLFITILATLLSISSIYPIIVPTVNAAELNFQEETFSVLSDVIGLKTEQYTETKNTQQDKQFLGNPQTEISSDLTSAKGSLRVTCSFVKDTLELVYLK